MIVEFVVGDMTNDGCQVIMATCCMAVLIAVMALMGCNVHAEMQAQLRNSGAKSGAPSSTTVVVPKVQTAIAPKVEVPPRLL